MTRLFFYVWFVLMCGEYATVSKAADFGYPFTFEIRIPRTANPDIKQSRVVYVANHGVKAVNLWVCKQREEAGFLVFQREFLIFPEDKPQRGLIIQSVPVVSQVFRLSIRQIPIPQDWSQWQRPNYVETGGAAWSFFMPDSQVTNRSTNVPPVCFEVRYKIERKRIE
jgi:hypothetical protein